MRTHLVELMCFCTFTSLMVVCGQENKGNHFLCTAVPIGEVASCPLQSAPVRSSAREEELKTTVIQLRETVVQQKKTIVNQLNTIKELTNKLSRCKPAGKNSTTWRKNNQTMDDVPNDPNETIKALTRTMQSLKERLQNLEQQRMRANLSGSAFPSALRELLQRRLWELERQLKQKDRELAVEKAQLYNDTAAHRQRTESVLHSLKNRISDLEKGHAGFKSPEGFKLSFTLRRNYLFGRVKKSLPEMYAFTVCMWLRSSASPGVGTPFSYGVPGQANEIVLIEWGNNPMELLINNKVAQLPLYLGDGVWHHICITWTTRDGVWEAYQDGQRRGTGEYLASWHPIKPGGVLILGQEQDMVGGRFDAIQAFVGELCHFNMWDRVLKHVDISAMANCSTYMPGNVVAWENNNVDVFGGASKLPHEFCGDMLYDN
ncbi:neuronal pentraxin-2b [Brachyhypopomus gauderio]|uniref:neuronal pentraxin-2b n=1 Tax=Brachyhypopomus gauderio TaxID=698409 RepID=UPI00404271CD